MKRIIQVIGLFAILSVAVWSCNKVMDAKPVETEAADTTYKATSQGTPYLQASSSYTQLITISPQKADINTLDGDAVKISLINGGAQVELAGEYLIVAAPQVGRIVPSGGFSKFTCWLEVNGMQVDNSNVLLTLANWTKDVIITQGIVSLDAGDIVTVMVGANPLGKGVALEAIAPEGQPKVPALIFTMYKIN